MRGCPFHNAAVEAADAMPEIHGIVQEHKQNYINGLVKLANRPGQEPQAPGQPARRALRRRSGVSTSLDDPAPWTHARKAAQTLIDLAVGESSLSRPGRLFTSTSWPPPERRH